jgi:spermidine/putrescine transport system permease protein
MTGPGTRRLLATHAWAVYAFLYAPILVLVAYSFNEARRGARWTGVTWHWYEQLAADAQMRDAMANSLIVAAAAAALSTLVGTAAALGLHRLATRRARGGGQPSGAGHRGGAGAGEGALGGVTLGLLYLPIVIPEIVLGVALVSFFGLVGARLSLGTVILAHLTFSVSYVAIVVRARLAGIDPSLEEAATDLGAGPLGAFARVTLPLIAPGVIAAALLVFTVSLDDYVVTSLVAGPGSTTLPLRIYGMLKVEVTPKVNAASTVLLLLTVVLIAVSQRLMAPRKPAP